MEKITSEKKNIFSILAGSSSKMMYVKANIHKIIETFGQPSVTGCSGDEKVQVEWAFQDKENPISYIRKRNIYGKYSLLPEPLF